ncbi:hypothetical protein H9L10_10915 [Phycicoccus endophyticus]|uniref:DUF2178 domain-containing protein n=1 Tax=Phycicoccus endophyticus TaxID=1690220 RepID=A0A7G9QZM1_9MICO|nr:hypothetical protein [Phycicoccus endophyticus]NHI19984.1 hypothetical protein [Phycicoccus endophyticus]QNN48796.1 hypothetical protein H9L10_10915 [Phycicoccus endophyticus]GGL42845.1 hypothetical protein GCM10012283_26810 [Phycicoccus endophyticus]
MDTPRQLTWFNRILLAVVVAGGLWCTATGVWWFAAGLLGTAAALGVVLWRAVRGRGSDTRRLDAAQPFDEREHAASTWSFAVVGRTAIVALVAAVVVQAATRDGRVDATLASALVLVCLVWATAIRLALRRA